MSVALQASVSLNRTDGLSACGVHSSKPQPQNTSACLSVFCGSHVWMVCGSIVPQVQSGSNWDVGLPGI